jgi:hypothetical protein
MLGNIRMSVAGLVEGARMRRINLTRRRRDRDARGMRLLPAWQVVALTVLTLALAATLTSRSLVHGAETKPFGADRDRWLAVWRPFEAVAATTRLDRPRAWLGGLVDDEPQRSPAAAVAAATVAPDPTAAPEATPTRRPTVTPPTRERPLRLWAGGDSLAEIVSESIARTAADTGVVDARVDARIATGLTRPDYFDWPAEFARVLATFDPGVVIVTFGANDSQGIMTADGRVLQPQTDGWRAEYGRRVAALMDQVRRPGRMLIWIGLPPMRNSDFDARMADIDAVVRWQAALRPDVVYIDARAVLGDADGRYAAYLPDARGNRELAREPDGIHVTRAGGDRLAAAVWYAIVANVDFSAAR